jgi:hypothetical protein
MLAGTGSFATQTRTMVMGDNDGIMVDDYNVFRFPGRTYNYPNLAVAEFHDVDDFYNFGINWQFGDDTPWVLGTYFSTLGEVVPSFLDGSSMVAWDGPGNNNRRINIVYGRQLGANNFGFHFDYTRGSWEMDETTDQSKESFGYYVFGFGLTEGSSGKWDLALQYGLGTWTDENVDGDDSTKSDGYYDLDVEGRFFVVKSPKVTLVPHAGFAVGKRAMIDFGVDLADAADDITTKQTAFGFIAGIGMNYTSGPDLLGVCDLGIMYGKIKTEVANVADDTWKVLSIPYFKIGLEADVFRWMDIRMGATSYWNITDIESDIFLDQKVKFAENDTYLGFGFHWGRLHVDTYTDPQLFLDGFNFVSGGTNDMNFQISALYEMF